MPSWFALLWAFLFRKPLILTQHVAMVPHTSRIVMFGQKVAYAIFGKLIFAYATKIVVYNPQVRDILLSYGVPADKILLTHNGIETKVFNKKFGFDVAATRRGFGLPVNRKLVLFVGRLVPKKGYDILFDARDDSFDLVYVGSGEVPKEWLTLQNFHFLGARTQAELAQLYQSVDLFVFPAEGEMFTLVMQEAMASGLPVIATAEPGYNEYDIDRNLLLLCERSSRVFKEHILSVLADTDRLEAMSRYSMQLSKQYFDWETNFASVLAIYDSLQKPVAVSN
jgi:glycosyltransferase involved in cell wall biosynthesis